MYSGVLKYCRYFK